MKDAGSLTATSGLVAEGGRKGAGDLATHGGVQDATGGGRPEGVESGTEHYGVQLGRKERGNVIEGEGRAGACSRGDIVGVIYSIKVPVTTAGATATSPHKSSS